MYENENRNERTCARWDPTMSNVHLGQAQWASLEAPQISETTQPFEFEIFNGVFHPGTRSSRGTSNDSLYDPETSKLSFKIAGRVPTSEGCPTLEVAFGDLRHV